MYIVCTADTEGALPLCDKLDGDICLHVLEIPDSEDYKKKAEQYELLKVTSHDYASFQGFVAGMSYDEGVREEILPTGSSSVLTPDGELIGCVADGSFYSWVGYNSDPLDSATERQCKIFLPTDGELRKTEYHRSTTIYGSDGEENDYIYYIHMACRKRELK